MRPPRRELTDDEMALWRHVTRNVTPHAGRALLPPARHPTPEPAPPPTPAPTPRVQPRPPVTPPPLALGATAGIDRRAAQRLTRGQMTIEARLDLHGMTLREAHEAVVRFVTSAAHLDRRCVLIITGKGGGPAGDKPGRIRTEALHWLSHASLRPLILAVHQARPQHGGGGALYVLLKRRR